MKQVQCIFIILFTIVSFHAHSESTPKSISTNNEWKFLIEPYAWGPDVKVTSAADDRVRIGIDDIVENLDIAAMLILGARNNKWSILLDTIYMDIGADDTSTANLIGISAKTKTSIDIKAWLLTLTGGYAVVDSDNTRLELFAGGRYYWEELVFKFDVVGTPGRARVSDTFDIWDGIIGTRGTTNISNKWYVSYYGDVGTGDSDLTYQIAGAANYKFKTNSLAVGYRYLEHQFDEDDNDAGEIAKKQIVEGPFIGFKFKF